MCARLPVSPMGRLYLAMLISGLPRGLRCVLEAPYASRHAMRFDTACLETLLWCAILVTDSINPAGRASTAPVVGVNMVNPDFPTALLAFSRTAPTAQGSGGRGRTQTPPSGAVLDPSRQEWDQACGRRPDVWSDADPRIKGARGDRAARCRPPAGPPGRPRLDTGTRARGCVR